MFGALQKRKFYFSWRICGLIVQEYVFRWINFKYFVKNLKVHVKHCTGYTQKDGPVSKVNKKFISHLTWARCTPSAAATLQVSHALITILHCVHPGSHDTHPHSNQIHPRPGVGCPL
jgi:hypothetical protein